MTQVAARTSRYFPALDGFRAVAVLLVFTHHYLGTDMPLIHNWGWIGVDFFFVLSGFLITGILWENRDAPHPFRTFYMRRILRIFPLYYAVWLGLLLLYPLFHWNWSWPTLLWPLHLGNLARFLFFNPQQPYHLDILQSLRHTHLLSRAFMGHFWSLCIEEQFYLIWPMMVLFVRSRRRLIWLTASVVLLEPALRTLLLFTLPKPLLDAEFLYRFTLNRVDGLALGGLLALMLRTARGQALLHRFGRPFSFATILGVVGFLLLYVQQVPSGFAVITNPLLSTIGFSCVDLLGAGILLELIRPRSLAVSALSWAPLRRLGQISYGFYVFHDLPHSLYDHAASLAPAHARVAIDLVALAGTLALSLLSYRFLEKPFLRLQSYFPTAGPHAAR